MHSAQGCASAAYLQGEVIWGGSAFPRPRAIEGVHADLMDAAHIANPVRPHPVGVVVGGLADLGEPGLAVEHVARDLPGLAPRLIVVDHKPLALAGEGELAGEITVGDLVEHAAGGVRVT